MRRVLTTLSLLAVLVAATLAAASPARAAPTLAVFGDSFSLTLRDGVRDWPALLQQRGLVGRIANFAVSGGSATPRPHRSFAEEVDRWERAGRPRGVTVVYLGYVDIGFIGGDLAKARAGYRDGIARLVRGGAASGANRLLLVEPHDVGSMPLFNRTAKRGALRRATEDWRGFVAGTARADGATPVDVFAAIDRVLKDPRAHGFTNVTTVDRARSATTALYREPFHVGQHGQAIIADTIAARLRRGAVVVAAADGAAWSPITPAVPAAVPTLLAAAFGPGDGPAGDGRDRPGWPY
jgi:phospholipase/lecithinase/hemolysin